MTESRAHAQAGGQTIVVIPAGNMEAWGAQTKGSMARQLVRRLGTFEAWKWKKTVAEGAGGTGTEAEEGPAKKKGKKEKVLQ